MEVKIIDRTDKEKKKSYEKAFADGLGMTIREVREAIREILELEKKQLEAESEGMTVSIGHTVNAGKVLMGGSWRKLIK